MECKYCGKKLIDGAEYCVYCGKPAVKEPRMHDKELSKQNNNNPVIVAILIILLLVILFGGGIFVYKKFIEKPKNKNNDVVEKSVEEKEKIPSITKNEVEELIDTYYFTGRSASENLFTISMDDVAKKTIALKNVYNDTKIVTCDQISNFTEKDGTCINDEKHVVTQGRTIDYDTLNNKYKSLFGKQNADITKESIKSLNEITTWEYNENTNNFLETFLITGFESLGSQVVYGVKDYLQKEDKLIVKVGYILIEEKEENGNVNYSAKIGDEEVKYSFEEIEKDTFDKEFKDKYLDKLDTYEFTFRYEDDHYVFESIKKI